MLLMWQDTTISTPTFKIFLSSKWYLHGPTQAPSVCTRETRNKGRRWGWGSSAPHPHTNAPPPPLHPEFRKKWRGACLSALLAYFFLLQQGSEGKDAEKRHNSTPPSGQLHLLHLRINSHDFISLNPSSSSSTLEDTIPEPVCKC